nr:E-beta-farnesene synthase 1 [Tanacetum cinerariifolium]
MRSVACKEILEATVKLNYGTYEELEIFSQAVERWSISCLDMLPEYMKLMYQELENLHVDMEESLEKEGRSYQINYVKEMAKELVRNYLVEARWLKEGDMPTLEYMSVSMVTGTYGLMIARSYVGRDDIITEDTFKLVSSYPPIIKASCVIVRLMDDIVSHEEEQERGHVASSIECYSKESGASEEEACEYISRKVEDAWKVINRESLRPTAIPFPLLMPAINLARMCEVLYSVNDGFTHAGEEMISYNICNQTNSKITNEEHTSLSQDRSTFYFRSNEIGYVVAITKRDHKVA